MPNYDFQCQECDLQFERRLAMKDKVDGNIGQCPQCGSNDVQQAFRTVMFTRSDGSDNPAVGGGCGPGCNC